MVRGAHSEVGRWLEPELRTCCGKGGRAHTPTPTPHTSSPPSGSARREGPGRLHLLARTPASCHLGAAAGAGAAASLDDIDAKAARTAPRPASPRRSRRGRKARSTRKTCLAQAARSGLARTHTPRRRMQKEWAAGGGICVCGELRQRFVKDLRSHRPCATLGLLRRATSRRADAEKRQRPLRKSAAS